MSGICDKFGGSLTADVLNFNPDAIPEPDTLVIRMTRGERRIADELRKAFGGFRRVVIDVDGDEISFSADSLIRLLEGYEGARDTSRYAELFGTPERAARTLTYSTPICIDCAIRDECEKKTCIIDKYDTMLEWLRGDA